MPDEPCDEGRVETYGPTVPGPPAPAAQQTEAVAGGVTRGVLSAVAGGPAVVFENWAKVFTKAGTTGVVCFLLYLLLSDMMTRQHDDSMRKWQAIEKNSDEIRESRQTTREVGRAVQDIGEAQRAAIRDFSEQGRVQTEAMRRIVEQLERLRRPDGGRPPKPDDPPPGNGDGGWFFGAGGRITATIRQWAQAPPEDASRG
jgi:hypothetical protein